MAFIASGGFFEDRILINFDVGFEEKLNLVKFNDSDWYKLDESFKNGGEFNVYDRFRDSVYRRRCTNGCVCNITNQLITSLLVGRRFVEYDLCKINIGYMEYIIILCLWEIHGSPRSGFIEVSINEYVAPKDGQVVID